MSVLGRIVLENTERLDTADFTSIDNYISADFKYLLQGLIGENTPYILKGCEVSSPTIAFADNSIAINIAGTVLWFPTARAGSFYYGGDSLDAITPTLIDNATNYIYATLNTENGNRQIRSFWSPDLNSGLGGESSREVDTQSSMILEISSSIDTFTEDVLPICIVVTDSDGYISSIQDCRNMMFRLGTGGASPNTSNDYAFRSLPSTQYARAETDSQMSTVSDPNCFQGGDKNIYSLKEWMDTAMTKFKELGDTSYWYERTAPVNEIFAKSGNFIKFKGIWTCTLSGNTPSINFTDDILAVSSIDPRILRFKAPGVESTFLLENNQIIYADVISRNKINNNDSPVIWNTSSKLVTGDIGYFSNLQEGDWIKKKSDGADHWKQIDQFFSDIGGTIPASSPIIAKSLRLVDNYIGTTGSAITEYSKGIYSGTDLKVVDAGDSSLQDLDGTFFWLAMRSDIVLAVDSIIATTTAIDVVNEETGFAECTTVSPHGLQSGFYVYIPTYGIYPVVVGDSYTFYVPNIGTGSFTSEFTYSVLTTKAKTSSIGGIELESANHSLQDGQTILITNSDVGYTGDHIICVIDDTSIQFGSAIEVNETALDCEAALVRISIRTETGVRRIELGQSVDTGDNTKEAIKEYIGMANSPVDNFPNYSSTLTPEGTYLAYNTIENMDNYNCDPDDSLTTRLAKLTSMMADRVQDREIVFHGDANITNTIDGSIMSIEAFQNGSNAIHVLTLTTTSSYDWRLLYQTGYTSWIPSGSGSNTVKVAIEALFGTNTVNVSIDGANTYIIEYINLAGMQPQSIPLFETDGLTEVQRIQTSMTPSSGYIVLGCNGESTPQLPYYTSAQAIADALSQALGLPSSSITGTGLWSTGVEFTFNGAYAQNRSWPPITVLFASASYGTISVTTLVEGDGNIATIESIATGEQSGRTNIPATIHALMPQTNTSFELGLTFNIYNNQIAVWELDRNVQTTIIPTIYNIASFETASENQFIIGYKINNDFIFWNGIKLAANEIHTYGESSSSIAYKNQDRNFVFNKGSGTWEWTLGTETLTWSSDFFLSTIGEAPDRYTIAAGSQTGIEDGEAVYTNLDNSTTAYSARIYIEDAKFKMAGQDIYLNGVNTPWNTWNDFGSSYDHEWWDAEFQRLVANDINAVRIWINCNSDNVGVILDSNGVCIEPTVQFWTDLDDLMNLATTYRIYVMPVIMSFDHLRLENNNSERWQLMIEKESNVESFANTFLVPMCERYIDNVYFWAVDLCNELDMATETMTQATPRNSTVTPVGGGSYIYDTSARLSDYVVGQELRITDGNGGWIDCGAVVERVSDTQMRTDEAFAGTSATYYSNAYEWGFTGMSWSTIQRYLAILSAAVHHCDNPILVTYGAMTVKYASANYSGNMISDAILESYTSDSLSRLDFNEYHWYSWEQPYFELLASPTTHGLDATKPHILGEISAKFQNLNIYAVRNWLHNFTYTIGDIVQQGLGDLRKYRCTQSGISGLDNGPTGTGTGIVDGTCTWDYLTDGVTWRSNTAYSLWDNIISDGNIYVCTQAGTSEAGGAGPLGEVLEMPMVSETAPAYVSYASAFTDADDARSRDGTNLWQVDSAENFPCWVAYDLSGLSLTDIIAHWWTDGQAVIDTSLNADVVYRCPGPYVIEGNTASGGGTPPISDWVQLATGGVIGTGEQNLKEFAHSIDFTGYNWIRYRVTELNAKDQNGGMRAKFEVFDTSTLPVSTETSDWFFMGDSITQGWLHTDNLFPVALSTLTATIYPDYFPMARSGGHGGAMFSTDMALSAGWIAETPGRYCVLAYGTNETWTDGSNPEWNNWTTTPSLLDAPLDYARDRIEQIITAGKIPIISVIPWNNNSSIQQANIVIFNEALAGLTSEYPTLLVGPDLYTLFTNQTGWMYDGVHPNATGCAQLAEAWSQWAYDNMISSGEVTPPSGTGVVVDGTVEWTYQRDEITSIHDAMEYFYANGWNGHFPWTSNGVDINGGLYYLNRQGGYAVNWAASTQYYTNYSVINNNRMYRALNSGLSATSGGPTGTGTSITDNELIWSYVMEIPASRLTDCGTDTLAFAADKTDLFPSIPEGEPISLKLLKAPIEDLPLLHNTMVLFYRMDDSIYIDNNIVLQDGAIYPPIRALGDIAYGDIEGTIQRLAIGTNEYVLTSNGSTIGWEVKPEIVGTTYPLNITSRTDINSTTSDKHFFKYKTRNTLVKNTWTTTGANINIARNSLGGCGTQTATLIAAGIINSYEYYTNSSEIFNGRIWAAAGNLPVAKALFGCVGSIFSALVMGGPTLVGQDRACCIYNGFSWSTLGDMLTAPANTYGAAGTRNAALAYGESITPSQDPTPKTHYFNGQVWRAGTTTLASYTRNSGCGTQNAALSIGGQGASYAVVNCYNLTSSIWKSIASLNTARSYCSTSGTQNAALATCGVGGMTDVLVSVVEKYNGVVWSSTTSPITARHRHAGTGTANLGLIASGATTGYAWLPTFEKFVGENDYTLNTTIMNRNAIAIIGDSAIIPASSAAYPDSSIVTTDCIIHPYCSENEISDLSILQQTLDTGTVWSTGATMSYLVADHAGTGVRDSIIIVGGRIGSGSGTESATCSTFNGTNWSTLGVTLNSATQKLCAIGLRNAALAIGGEYSQTPLNTTQYYNGTSWSNRATLPRTMSSFGATGVYNAALVCGGNIDYGTKASIFNGTSWTDTSDLTIASYGSHRAVGSTNASLVIIGGSLHTLHFNGVTWLRAANINHSRDFLGIAGVKNTATIFGGYDSGTYWSTSERYNGVCWSSICSLGTVRRSLVGVGTSHMPTATGGENTGGNLSSTENLSYTSMFSNNYIGQMVI